MGAEEALKLCFGHLVSGKGRRPDTPPVRLDDLNPFSPLLSPPLTILGFLTWEREVSHYLGSVGSHDTGGDVHCQLLSLTCFVASSVTRWKQPSSFSWLISALCIVPTNW